MNSEFLPFFSGFFSHSSLLFCLENSSSRAKNTENLRELSLLRLSKKTRV
ncbi:unknown protein [Simkania negevensis Z]|uniref:Uncharacterized protein n=1 Tax=Simkania negevensis (strain ATCC VR-1471 / DSM 27360 / Z) TaxID=331113 RepID=F8L3N8_SIMNZ|nr:unknown protein [Simkania negevensis Z]